MSIGDNRIHPRVKTNNKVSYVIVDDRGNEIEGGLGKIMDVSLGGILIETIRPIGLHNIELMTSGIDHEILNMKGNVVYCNPEGSGTFRTGIKFLEAKEDIRLFVTNLLKINSKQKTQN